MGMRCFSCSLTPILAVAGLLGLGAAGYRVATDGCPFCQKDDAATTKLVSTSAQADSTCPMMNMTHEQLGHTKLMSAEDQKSACCAGMTPAECEAKMADCPASSGCCKGEGKKAAAPEKVATTGK